MSNETLHTRIGATPVLVTYTDGEPDGIAYYGEMDVHPHWVPSDLAAAVISHHHEFLCAELADWKRGAGERAMETQADELYSK
jgi:hypothetical protein